MNAPLPLAALASVALAAAEPDSPSGILADSQFDYPGQPHGWRYYALNAANEFAPMQAVAEAAATATPLAFLGCDDPYARIGRDALHPGYQRRPCIQWHPREAGTYHISGELALINSQAAGALQVRVIVDDVELLTHDLVYPQVLEFELDVAVRAGGFVRLLFASQGVIDHKDTLYYLRARHANTEMQPGVHRMTRNCSVPAAWQRLIDNLGRSTGLEPQHLAQVAQNLFQPSGQADPVVVQQLQAAAEQRFLPKMQQYRMPRYFSIHPVSSSSTPPAA